MPIATACIRTLSFTVIGSLVCLAPYKAHATVNIVLEETLSGDVLGTLSGNLDLTGLGPNGYVGNLPAFINPAFGNLLIGDNIAYGQSVLAPVVSFIPFGSGIPAIASSQSGQPVGIPVCGSLPCLVVPAGYTSGSPLGSTALWANSSFSSLGLLVHSA